ncbi:MAG: 4Fe-4S dicluster domain-containing protein [Promethearchaeota archaeon]
MAKRQFIVCDPIKCDGCGICELACSQTKSKVFNPELSRIRVIRVDHIANAAIACRQCEDAKCIAACAKEALEMKDGILVCDAEKCNLETMCIEACPFGALFPDHVKKEVIACDLCPDDRIDGKPPCVYYCPKEALSLETAEAVTQKEPKNILLQQLEEAEKQEV